MPPAGEHFVFDAFGTLFDVHAAARASAPLIGESWPRVSEVWRAKQLEYSWIHAGLGTHVPFRDLTRQGLHYALSICGVDAGVESAILESYGRLAVFPEVPDVLRGLKAQGAHLAILSNGDPDVLDGLVAHADLGGVFDRVLSVQAAGTFKPSPRVYALVTEAFPVAPGAITFLSSNRWDIAGASAFGFTPIWVNRADAPDEYPDLAPQRVVRDLRALL
ncbi:MAG: haloacid dehalogenase type II [Hyphomicrobium sp.]